VGKTAWRTEPTRVENLGDDLCVGVKGQSNSVIAGSPRNAFRCSVACCLPEVGLWMADGPDKVTDVSQTSNAGKLSVAVRLRGISSVVERETAQITD
jgi:hypothetical protein